VYLNHQGIPVVSVGVEAASDQVFFHTPLGELAADAMGTITPALAALHIGFHEALVTLQTAAREPVETGLHHQLGKPLGPQFPIELAAAVLAGCQPLQ